MKTIHLRILFLGALVLLASGLYAQTKTRLSVTNMSVTQTKTYDASTSSMVTNFGQLVGNTVPGHTNVYLQNVAAEFDSKNAGSRTVTVTFILAGPDKDYYDLPDSVITGCSITPAQLSTWGQALVQPKPYDGTTSVIILQYPKLKPSEVLGNDVVYLNTDAQYVDKNADYGKQINFNYSLTGPDKDNYFAPVPAVQFSDIYPKELTVSGTTVNSKVYDQSTSCSVNYKGTFATQPYSGDIVDFTATAQYVDATAAVQKQAIVSYVTTGRDKDNYTIADNTVYGSITKVQLTAQTDITLTKTFDNNSIAGSSLVSATGILNGDDVQVIPNASYDNSAVGTGKTITVTYTLDGDDYANYIEPVSYSVYNGEITKRPFTVTTEPTYSNTKTYDGTDTIFVTSPGILDGLLPGNTVYITAVAHYNDSSAAENKTITITYVLSGPNAGDYEAPAPIILNNGVITPKTLHLDNPPVIAQSKPYDGLPDIQVIQQPTATGLLPGDDVTILADAALTSSVKVGDNRPVTVTYRLTGPAASNYSVPNNTTTTAEITRRQLTILPPTVQDSKIYDGSTTSSVTTIGGLTNIVGSDIVTVSATAEYDNKNVGYNNKDVIVSYNIYGTDAGNYFAPVNDTVHNKSITEKQAEITGTTLQTSKVYDASDTAFVTFPGSIINSGKDVVTVVAHAHYSDKNVGNNKNVVVTYTLEGANAGNYTVPAPVTLHSSITPKAINVSSTDPARVEASKVYNGTRTCDVVYHGSPDFVYPGDVIGLYAEAQYLDSTVATGKPVVINYTLIGMDKDNYTLSMSSGGAFADITPVQLSVLYTDIALSKQYDGTADAAVRSTGILQGLMYMDSLVTLDVKAVYDNANVAPSKQISITYTLKGKGSANYLPPVAQPLVGQITAKTTYVTGTQASEKYYDGTTLVAVPTAGTLNGKLAKGDVQAVVDTAYFLTTTADLNKPVYVQFKLTGSDKDNYTVPDPVVVYADILPRQLSIYGTTVETSKTYDGSAAVSVTNDGTLVGIVGNDDVHLHAIAYCNDHKAGNNKLVTVEYTLSGDDAGNYIEPIPGANTYRTSILPLNLTITGTQVAKTKSVDGTTAAAINLIGNLGGVIGNDNVSATGDARYNDPNVGIGKTITVTYTLVGTDKDNYVKPAPDVFPNCTITSVQPDVINTDVVAQKIYDGNTNVKVNNPGTLVNVNPSHNVYVTATARYDRKDVSSSRRIIITYALGGSDAGNYVTPAPDTINGVITPLPITAYGAQVTPSKTYDGATSAVIANHGYLNGSKPNDDIRPVAVANYNDKNVGVNKEVYISYKLDGADSINYSLSIKPDTTVAAISRATFTVGSTNIQTTKPYDGTTIATVLQAGKPVGHVQGDDLAVTAVANYNNSQVGTGKNITVVYTVTGRDSANYFKPANLILNNGVITAPKPTVIDPQVITFKIYDGTDTAKVTYPGSLVGVDPALDVTLTATARFDNKNQGSGKDIIVTFHLIGNDSYYFTDPDPKILPSIGRIDPKPITPGYATVTSPKVYDGTTSATILSNGTLIGVISPDTVTLVASAIYRDFNVNDNVIADITYTLAGPARGNYTLTSTTGTTTGEIIPATITVSDPTVVLTKNYDGNNSAQVVDPGTIVGLIGSDQVTLNATALYNNASVDTGKTITVYFTLSGPNSANYNNPAPVVIPHGVIKAVKPTVNGYNISATKEYDGTTIANVISSGSLVGVDPSLDVQVTAVAHYNNKNVGSGKDVKITFTLTGNDSYMFVQPDSVILHGFGTITAKSVTASGTTIARSKPYDGTTDFTVINPGTVSPVIATDVVNLVATASFRSKDVETQSKTVDLTYSLSGTDSRNYSLTNKSGTKTADITPINITVSDPTVILTKNYDGNNSAQVVDPGTIVGLIGSDQVTLNATALYNNASVDTGKTITVYFTLSGPNSANYNNPAPVVIPHGVIKAVKPTVNGYNISATKEYDGTTIANVISSGSLVGVDPSLDVQVTAVAHYNDKNADSGKDIKIIFTLTGNDSYMFDRPDSVILHGYGTITAKDVTASGTTIAPSKPYDGTTDVTVINPGTVSTIIAPDVVNLVTTASYQSKDVEAQPKTVDLNYSLSGTDSRNYSLTNKSGTRTAVITPINISVADPTVVLSKNYDGNNTAQVIDAGTIVGLIGNDQVTLVPTATYNSASVGTGKPITITYTLAGAHAANYNNPAPVIIPGGSINAVKPTVANYVISDTKVYDGTKNAAVLSPGSLVGVDPSLDVQVTAVAQYSDKNVGSGKDVKILFTLTGNDRNMFVAPDSVILTGFGTINAKPLIASGVTLAPSKTYDGTTAISVTSSGMLSTVIAPDVVNLSATAAFRTKDVETSPKLVDVTYSISGTDAYNYYIQNPNVTSTSTIVPAATLSVLGTDVVRTKTYDGNTDAAITTIGSVYGLFGTDQVTLIPTSSYNNKYVGNGKLITVSYRISGRDSMNYLTPSDVVFTNCAITKVKPTVSGVQYISTKEYDGTSIMTVTNPGTLSGTYGANVSLVANGRFDDKNVGTSKDLIITFALTGADAGNFDAPDSLYIAQEGTITAKDIYGTGAYVVGQKNYDGTTTATVAYNGSFTGVIAPDSVVPYVIAYYDTRNVGTGKTVYLIYHMTGPDAGNYNLVNKDQTDTATILPRTVTVIGTTVQNVKMYDATIDCQVITPGIVDSLCAGDNITVNAVATYDNKNVDSLKTITISYTLSGADAANYIVVAQDSVKNGQITPASLGTYGMTVDEWKSYDGNTTALMTTSPSLTGVLGNDLLYITASADFDTPAAGTGKTITVAYNVFGPDAFNYFPLPQEIYSNNGIIFEHIYLASDTLSEFGTKVITDNANYCGGNEVNLLFTVAQGDPYDYRIEFSPEAQAAGFTDIGWVRMPVASFNIPDSCEGGVYMATIQFRNRVQSRDNLTIIDRDTVYIIVNLSNRYITDIFKDVVSIDNREERFRSYQWFKDGQEIANANLPYYQDKGGLDGVYHVIVNLGEADEAVICSKEFHHIANAPQKTISAYPNPAENELNITLNGFDDQTHQLMMVNAAGYIVVNEKFNGTSYQVNVSTLPAGTYTVFVDGESVKAIKK